jgi:hypothetical protein
VTVLWLAPPARQGFQSRKAVSMALSEEEKKASIVTLSIFMTKSFGGINYL